MEWGENGKRGKDERMTTVGEGTGIKIKSTLLIQGHLDTTGLAKMLRYISAVFFILLALSYMSSAAPSEPQHPGDQASPEQMAQYYSDLWQYITFVTRPRFGKRWNEVGVEDVPSY